MTHQQNNDDAAVQLRDLPSVHDLLSHARLVEACQRFGHDQTRDAARVVIDRQRSEITAGSTNGSSRSLDCLAKSVVHLLNDWQQLRIRKVINATGILLHTGLGRAPLAPAAVEAIYEAAGYCNVELDLVSGNRSRRTQCVEADLRALTGAEASLVVNNNAGATGLVLAELARGREVVVSQGELIEIGGGFRLPEVFQAYGARLKAVGTTNRTRIADYANAITSETGALMVIHPSNYRVVGFTEQPKLKDIVALGQRHNIPVIHDVGSGALVNVGTDPAHAEPVVSESIRAGADLVLFSGDKLLGGPQCGIVVGKKSLLSRLQKHPMSRALRVDKLTLAALQATLSLYRQAGSDLASLDGIPLFQMLRAKPEELRERASTIQTRLSAALPAWDVSTKESVAYAGGGALPGDELPSYAIVLKHASAKPDDVAKKLRLGQPSIVGRVSDGSFWLDLRAVFPSDDELLCVAVEQVCSE